MLKILVFSLVLLLWGCDPFRDPTEVNVVIQNVPVGWDDPETIDRNGEIWLGADYEFADSSSICYDEADSDTKCELTSLVIVGKQEFLGVEYDSIDVLEKFGGLTLGDRYLFDNTYKILGDTLLLRFGQTNGTDTVYTEKTYLIE